MCSRRQDKCDSSENLRNESRSLAFCNGRIDCLLSLPHGSVDLSTGSYHHLLNSPFKCSHQLLNSPFKCSKECFVDALVLLLIAYLIKLLLSLGAHLPT